VGVHRLIRIGPFDSAGRRQTSFAAIDLVPEVDDNVDIAIDWDKDVREDVFCASGAGGQHVNKTSSAIRLTHLPTNTVVQCQNERSQHKNRAFARKMLTAKLFQMELERRSAEQAAKRGEKTKIGFGGGTIRTYELNPTQRVKDHRTMCLSNNPAKVFDGDIKEFLDAFLRILIITVSRLSSSAFSESSISRRLRVKNPTARLATRSVNPGRVPGRLSVSSKSA